MTFSEAVVWFRWDIVVRYILGLFRFQSNQRARIVPDRSYFVASNGQVMRKYPKLHMSKKRRLAQRLPQKLRKYVDESRAALEWAGNELRRKDAALLDIKRSIMAGEGFPAVIAKVREATA